MMLTTKARYAVMAIVDMANQCRFMEDGCHKATNLADIAKRQDITIAYLEQIFCKLKCAGIVKSQRGPGGGYILSKPATDIKIACIVNAVDETIKMTRCGSEKHKEKHHHHDAEEPKACTQNAAQCSTHKLWAGLENQIQNYLISISIDDVINKRFH